MGRVFAVSCDDTISTCSGHETSCYNGIATPFIVDTINPRVQRPQDTVTAVLFIRVPVSTLCEDTEH